MFPPERIHYTLLIPVDITTCHTDNRVKQLRITLTPLSIPHPALKSFMSSPVCSFFHMSFCLVERRLLLAQGRMGKINHTIRVLEDPLKEGATSGSFITAESREHRW